MTVFEILNFNRELITKLGRIGFRTEDCRYIDLYDEYVKMKRRGDKVTYIVLYLADKYGVSERKVYDIIKRFGSDCTEAAAQSGVPEYQQGGGEGLILRLFTITLIVNEQVLRTIGKSACRGQDTAKQERQDKVPA